MLRINELSRLYGIEHGGNRETQDDLAEEMGMCVDTLRNYKLLADMIPELSDLVDTGIVTKTTALALMKN